MLHMPPLEREGTQALAMFQMQALHDVVKAGYVRYIGMSSCWAYQCTVSCSDITLSSNSLSLDLNSPRHAEYVRMLVFPRWDRRH